MRKGKGEIGKSLDFPHVILCFDASILFLVSPIFGSLRFSVWSKLMFIGRVIG